MLKRQNGSHIEYEFYIKFRIHPKIIILRVQYGKNDFYNLEGVIRIKQGQWPSFDLAAYILENISKEMFSSFNDSC